MQLDTKMVKKSKERLVISGIYAEHTIYEKPFFWNFAPTAHERQHSLRSNKKQQRREDSIWRSRQNIMRLINANHNGYGEKTKFITYTFKREIEDLEVARFYWARYIREVKRIYPHIKYLGVAEIQKKRFESTGKKIWHFHVVFFNLPFLYRAKDLHHRLWGEGFIKIITIDHVKNVGLYVSKYLRKDLQEEGLWGEKSYFTSKGLKKPIQYRQQKNVNKFMQQRKFVIQSESTFQSKQYGIIRTYQLKKCI